MNVSKFSFSPHHSHGTVTVVANFMLTVGRAASRLQLLLLDATIIFLQVILTTIAYETSLARAMPDDYVDPLLSPEPTSPEDTYSTSTETETDPFLHHDPSSPAFSSSSHTYPPTSTSSIPSLTQLLSPPEPFATPPRCRIRVISVIIPIIIIIIVIIS